MANKIFSLNVAFICYLLMTGCQDSASRLDAANDEGTYGEGPYPGALYGEFFKGGKTDITFYVKDGEPLYQGDIHLSDGPSGTRFVSSGGESAGNAIRWSSSRWPNGVVPYRINDDLSNYEEVVAAIEHWEERTLIDFVEYTGQRDFITFRSGDSNCWSSVGRVGGEQFITLAPACGFSSVLHEIGHAMGLFHEQNRTDRDDFIEIVWDNIDPKYRDQFEIETHWAFDVGTFDIASVMHYRSTAFSVNGQPTIRRVGGEQIPDRFQLSEGDVATINEIYGFESETQTEEETLLASILAEVEECPVEAEIILPENADGNFMAQFDNEMKVEFNRQLGVNSNAFILRSLIGYGSFNNCNF